MIALVALVSTASATTWTVRADGSGDFSTIPAAISAAVNGDRIEVEAGDWAGPINFGGKNIEVVGTAGSDNTFLSGGGAAAVVRFETAEAPLAKLQGFTLQDADHGLWIDGASPSFADLIVAGFGDVGGTGGGATILDGRPVFEDVLFTDNIGKYGGALHATGGDVTCRRCTFETNGDPDYATHDTIGGAIHVVDADLTLDDCTFDRNQATAGAHVAAENSGTIELIGSSFVDGASDNGGVALLGAVWLDIEDSHFGGNAAYYRGGAVYAYEVDRVTVDTTTFADNTVYASGGGAALFTYLSGNIAISGCTFTDNIATYTYGAALHTSYAQSLSITDSHFEGQTSYYAGGAIYGYVLYGPVAITDSSFQDNEATFATGGAVHLDYGTAAVLVEETSFSRNRSGAHGGALYVNDISTDLAGVTFDHNEAVQSGGALRLDNTRGTRQSATLRHVVATDNLTTGDGGGLSIARLPDVLLEDVRATANRSGGAGGGIHVMQVGSLDARRVWSAGNQAVYGGGLYLADVGGIAPTAGDALLSLHNLLLAQNEARNGGGLCVVESVDATLRQATLVGNAATDAGAAICTYDQALDLQNTVLAWNTGAPALEPLDAPSAAATVGIYNAWYGNSTDAGALLDPHLFPASPDVLDPPRFAHSVLDADLTADAWTLSADSPLVDAGNPATLDPDGTPSDIGAFGGHQTWQDDADSDGFAAWQDCDDTDPTVQPGAEDSWYDGVDSNCDGADDFDQDGDGYAISDDCDDTDASAAEDCSEEDEDSGEPDREAPSEDSGEPTDAESPASGGSGDKSSGCATVGSTGGWLGVLALLGVVGRRRSGQEGVDGGDAGGVFLGVDVGGRQQGGAHHLRREEHAAVGQLAGQGVDGTTVVVAVVAAHHATAGEARPHHERAGVGPVVFAVADVELRCAAHLGQHHHHRLVDEAGGGLARQCGQRLHDAAEAGKEGLEVGALDGVIVGVGVPALAREAERGHPRQAPA